MTPCQALSNGKFVAFYQRKAQPDYKGTLAGGQSVVFEAKFTVCGKIEQSRVSEAQTECLAAHQRLGALCFVLVGFGMDSIYLIPWNIWRNMKAIFGRKYVTEVDLVEYKVPNGVNGMPDIFKNDLKGVINND